MSRTIYFIISQIWSCEKRKANSVNRDCVLPCFLVISWHVSQCLQIETCLFTPIFEIHDAFTINPDAVRLKLVMHRTAGEYCSIMPLNSAFFQNRLTKFSKCLLSLRFTRKSPQIFTLKIAVHIKRQNFIGRNRVFHDMTSSLYEY